MSFYGRVFYEDSILRQDFEKFKTEPEGITEIIKNLFSGGDEIIIGDVEIKKEEE